ncbi:Flp family type IVb pilin [Aggregatibacter actinomycetemcomitans]|uniref:Flp family type IVb pilin n=1 Tax=Aggregatibacter actinomycetemcomitans TaxID=714 RepID=UPI001E412653|nr:Flp family type IVb pilin [Aggregatibacter actinomycetemcomitans]
MLNTLTTKAYIKAAEAIRSFRENQAGVTAIEYGFIANLQNKFNSLASTVGSADVGKK